MKNKDFQAIGVIVGLDLVGDALIKLPFLRALRHSFPAAHLSWITSDGKTAFGHELHDLTRHLWQEVMERPPWLTGDTPQNTAPHFDLLIDTRGRWRHAVQSRQIPHEFFLSPAARFLFSDRRPSLFAPRPPHLVDRLLQLVLLAGGHLEGVAGALPIPDHMMTKARAILPVGPKYIGLAPGAGNPIKIWPKQRFAELAAALAERGYTPVFLLGPKELDWLDELKHRVPVALFPLQERAYWGGGALGLVETLAVGACLQAAIANDSGTGHMLAAVDCPLISLFGPTRAEKLAPRVTYGRVIKASDFVVKSRSMADIPLSAVLDCFDSFIAPLSASALRFQDNPA
jgi:ADP-heptose:LPS heptosyltransferase